MLRWKIQTQLNDGQEKQLFCDNIRNYNDSTEELRYHLVSPWNVEMLYFALVCDSANGFTISYRPFLGAIPDIMLYEIAAVL